MTYHVLQMHLLRLISLGYITLPQPDVLLLYSSHALLSPVHHANMIASPTSRHNDGSTSSTLECYSGLMQTHAQQKKRFELRVTALGTDTHSTNRVAQHPSSVDRHSPYSCHLLTLALITHAIRLIPIRFALVCLCSIARSSTRSLALAPSHFAPVEVLSSTSSCMLIAPVAC
jgi:hypothetical protein